MNYLPPPDNDDFYAELTRSRDWKSKGPFPPTMSFDKMWTRGVGIFYCAMLAVLITVTMVTSVQTFGWGWLLRLG